MDPKLTEILREQAMAKISLDPKENAKQLHDTLGAIAALLALTGASREEKQATILDVIEEHQRMFKAKVQDELLASQKQTNDALAAALRGGK